MPAYCLFCKSCDKYFKMRKDWLQHLLLNDHQILTRREVIEWSGDVKKCAIVIFASFPVAGLEVLEFFSKGMDIVTDFVSLPDKPCTGIFQFESGQKVKEILTKFRTSELRINNQLVELRKASNYLNLEWRQLLQHCELIGETKLVLKEKSEIEKNNNGLESERLSPLSNSSLAFCKQFETLRQKIAVPIKDYKRGLKIVQGLQQIFSSFYPSCQVYMFRHWFVGLAFNHEEEILLLLDSEGELTGCKDPEKDRPKISSQYLKEILGSPEAQKVLPCNEVEVPSYFNQSRALRYFGLPYEYKSLRFNFVCHNFLKIEAQTCRLFKYMSTFDSRVIVLLTMVHFWRKVNNVRLSTGQDKRLDDYNIAPEPASLHWLVMLVLCKNKIVPTPKEILSQPGKSIVLDWCGSEIGFCEDENVVKKWRDSVPEMSPESSDDFLWSVLELAETFFSTISALRYDYWVLNTRNGEIFEKSKLLQNPETLKMFTKMAIEDIYTLKDENFVKGSEKINRYRFEKTVLLHPLRMNMKFEFCSKTFVERVCPCMEVTAMKIKVMLASRKKGDYIKDLDLESLFKV